MYPCNFGNLYIICEERLKEKMVGGDGGELGWRCRDEVGEENISAFSTDI